MFKVKNIENKPVYYSDKINVEHFFTTRFLEVKENLDLIASYLKIDKKNIIKPTQTHSSNIEVVKKGVYEYPECDALILDKKGIAIYLNFADCTPVILYDTKNNIAAIAHAGWRGTAGKIAPKTVLKMKELYNTNPSDVVGLIGPCISFSCFETSLEAINLLTSTLDNPTGLFKENYADLKGINKRQLEEIGVGEIDVVPYCTVLDNDKFFSYRKENKTPKRHSALICLRETQVN